MTQALFGGLVFDEFDRPVEVGAVGAEPCYIVNDDGFRRHIPSQDVDLAVLEQIASFIQGHEEELGQQTARMLGSEDPFSQAMIQKQLSNLPAQFSALLETGFPEEMRAYLGMTGFKVVIDVHGNLLRADYGRGEEE